MGALGRNPARDLARCRAGRQQCGWHRAALGRRIRRGAGQGSDTDQCARARRRGQCHFPRWPHGDWSGPGTGRRRRHRRHWSRDRGLVSHRVGDRQYAGNRRSSLRPVESGWTRTAGDVWFRDGVERSFRGPRGRRITGSIEHVAPLLPGSSGGPIVNAEGRLLGLNTHRLGEGFYLAIPADETLEREWTAWLRVSRRAAFGLVSE